MTSPPRTAYLPTDDQSRNGRRRPPRAYRAPSIGIYIVEALIGNGTCFDIDGTTLEALERIQATGKPHSGPTRASSAGNGSLMRVAPVPLACAQRPGVARRFGFPARDWFAQDPTTLGRLLTPASFLRLSASDDDSSGQARFLENPPTRRPPIRIFLLRADGP